LASSAAQFDGLSRGLLDDHRPFDDVFQRGAVGEQVEVLEHEPGLLAQAANRTLLATQGRLASMLMSPIWMRPASGFPAG
jgi:hypothetical protein